MSGRGLELCWSPWGQQPGLDCFAPLAVTVPFPVDSRFPPMPEVRGLGVDSGGRARLLPPQPVSLFWQVFEKSPLRVKNFGIWLRYDSRSGTHNMYREYRDLTTAGAVTQCCKPPAPAGSLC